jgi:hypothetical protein
MFCQDVREDVFGLVFIHVCGCYNVFVEDVVNKRWMLFDVDVELLVGLMI